MLNQQQVSKLRKATKLAAILAQDGTASINKHPEVLAGVHSSFSLCCLASARPPGSLNVCTTGNHTVEDLMGHTGLAGHESAPVLPVPGMHPRMPSYIHTEAGPPTAHALHDRDPRWKNKKGTAAAEAPSVSERPNVDVV